MNPIRGENANWLLVLVVDECRMTWLLLSKYLRAHGFNVMVVENGVEAFEKMGRDACGLGLMDFNMPQRDGVEPTREIKAHPLYCQISVIMLTTQGEERERQDELEARVAVFLRKPISAERVTSGN